MGEEEGASPDFARSYASILLFGNGGWFLDCKLNARYYYWSVLLLVRIPSNYPYGERRQKS
jgi:hypothetical protein